MTPRRLACLLLAAMLLPTATGCALAIIGAAGAAGTAGYLYANGLLYRDYFGDTTQTADAVRKSLEELHLPLVTQKDDGSTYMIRTKTATNEAVRIYLDRAGGPIPSEKAVTRVGIRVGFSGDDGVSLKILDQVSKHLASPAPPPDAKPAGPPPDITGPPPIAPATPVSGAEKDGRLVPVAAK